nr:Acetate kinase [Ipomoea batatas]GME19624.1 Acetate kinase [Ipomoea batatas]
MERKRFSLSNFSRKWGKWLGCYGYREKDPVIQLAPVEIQGFHAGNADPSTYSGEVSSVWKKNIFMGAKCQLPDFSGVIIYDTAGNIVAPAKAPLALTWK